MGGQPKHAFLIVEQGDGQSFVPRENGEMKIPRGCADGVVSSSFVLLPHLPEVCKFIMPPL